MEKIMLIILLCSMTVSQAFANKMLRIPLNTNVVVFDTAKLQDSSSLWVSRQINCQLVRIRNGELTLAAARSIHYISPTLIDIQLRPNIIFSNGANLTAQDVVASFMYLKTHNHALGKNIFLWIEKLKIINDNELIIELNKPVPQFLTVLSAPYYAIFEKKFIDSVEKNPALWDKPVTCGGYKVSENNGRSIILEPKKSGLPIKFILTPNSQVLADQLNKYDLVTLEIIGKSPELKKFQVMNVFDPYQYYFAINTRKSVWQKKENRCAVFAKLDPEIPMRLYGNAVKTADDFIPSGTLGYALNSEYIEMLKKKFYATPAPENPKFCVSVLSSSIEKTYRPTFLKMFQAVYPNATFKLVASVSDLNHELSEQKCDGFLYAGRSNYLDGYEYLESFTKNEPSFSGYYNPTLANQILATQNLNSSQTRAAAYNSVIKKIIGLCLIDPLFTMPYDTIYVRHNLITPGLGQSPIDDYYLGKIERTKTH